MDNHIDDVKDQHSELNNKIDTLQRSIDTICESISYTSMYTILYRMNSIIDNKKKTNMHISLNSVRQHNSNIYRNSRYRYILYRMTHILDRYRYSNIYVSYNNILLHIVHDDNKIIDIILLDKEIERIEYDNSMISYDIDRYNIDTNTFISSIYNIMNASNVNTHI